MSVIQGKDAWLYWNYGGLWKPIACMRNWSLTTTAEKAETSTKQSGAFRTYRGIKNGWSLTCDGLQSFDTNFTVGMLTKAQLRWIEIQVIATATQNGITESYQGYVLVDDIPRSASHNGLYEYSVTATGTGILNVSSDAFDPNDITLGGLLMIYPYDGVGGEFTTGTIPDLVGMWVPTLARDGIIYRRIDDTAIFDVTKKEFKYNDVSGVTFNTDLPPLQPGEAVDIAYQQQP